MVNISAVRNALAAQVNQYAYPALRMLPDAMDQVNPPVGVVLPARNYIDYVTTLDGATGFGGYIGGQAQSVPVSDTNFGLDIMVVVAKASTLERAESDLDLWLGFQNSAGTAVSVAAAVMKDPTLGGTVHWCLPVSADAPGPVDWNTVQYFGARVHFQLSAL